MAQDDAPDPFARLPARRDRRDAARLAGSPEAGAVPRMETVRITAPDLVRRAAQEKTRQRLVLTAGIFGALFTAVIAKLTVATVLFPMAPSRAEIRAEQPPAPDPVSGATPATPVLAAHAPRATITDRNGQIMAISIPTAQLFADPREMIDPRDAARRLHAVLPRLEEKQAETRLLSARQFVYLERQITPAEEIAINDLGIPGIYFRRSEKRQYPLGRVAAQVLGGVDVDSHGVAGVERSFDHRLATDPTPLRLSIDLRVQAVMRDELAQAMAQFTASGACGIVMDVRTGEILAMVSLPDYDANDFGSAPAADRFNRAVTGMYEPGSTFKLQTAAMALDFGTAHIWDSFDAAHPIHIGRFTITDFEGKHRALELPEVLAYSSNLGAAHIALTVGAAKQRLWLSAIGMFRRIGVELPEAGLPIVPSAANWGEATVMTVGFGHGIAVSPLHVVRGTAALANGGTVLRPTLLAQDGADDAPPVGRRIMALSTSDTIRKLMRLVVTNGYGKPADVAGYYVGGKTGTAEKVGSHGYKKHSNVSAFISVFPMNAPRYAVYFMLDEPHGTKATGGFSTAGAVSAPAAGRVIARIAPMLGLFPDVKDAAAIDASLAIPMAPARGSGEPTGTASPLLAEIEAAAPRPEAVTVSAPAPVLPRGHRGHPLHEARPVEERRAHRPGNATPPVGQTYASLAAR